VLKLFMCWLVLVYFIAAFILVLIWSVFVFIYPFQTLQYIKDGRWTVWHTNSDSRWWTASFERRNRARNSLSSYFVSASSRSFSSRHLLGFVTLKNSRISMSVFVRSAIVFWFTCVKSRVQRLIARNRRFRFKLKFKADRVQLKMVQRTIVVNQFTAAYLIRVHCWTTMVQPPWRLHRPNWESIQTLLT